MTKSTSQQLREQFPDIEYQPLPPPEKHPMWTGAPQVAQLRAFSVATLFERDIAVPMRDGVTLYTDVFRPAGDGAAPQVPAILVWSPSGKSGTFYQYESMGPFSCGVDATKLSGYHKWEGPDPAEWTERGYAVINIDIRGIAKSGGDTVMWGTQDAQDIYDTAEWLAKQPWSNGSVVMCGNSWLGMSQLNFASRLNHPAIKAIAPWEGSTDLYQDIYMRGGFPHLIGFTGFITGAMAGPNSAEIVASARTTHPLRDAYWQSKRFHVENIDIPIYQTASYGSLLHVHGSFEAFEKAKTGKKWIRVHPFMEWPDNYRPEMVDDLQRFYDTYAKGLDNGWERDTPPVRLSLLGFDGGAEPIIQERPETAYPVPGTKATVYHFDASSHTLTAASPAAAATASHEGHSLTASSDFKVVFDRRTEVAGYATVKLWMSCDAHDDMDVVVQLRKIDKDGNLLSSTNCPIPVLYTDFPEERHTNVSSYLGPQGQLRASHAVSRDAAESTALGRAVYKHDTREPVLRGTVVPLEITLWPIGIVFGPGEGIVLRVAGHTLTLPEVPPLALKAPEDANVGTHVIYAGGEYDSYLVLPVLPEKKSETRYGSCDKLDYKE